MMSCKYGFDVKIKVWYEQEDKASKGRGGRSSVVDPGFRTTTFTLFLNLWEGRRQEMGFHLFRVYSTLIYHTEEEEVKYLFLFCI